MHVIDAKDFVIEPPGTPYEFGEDLAFTLKNSPKARSFAAKGFEIRFIPLNDQGQVEAWAFFPPCRVYYAGVETGFVARPGVLRVNLGRLTDLSWLRLTRGAPPKSAKFLVIFEDTSDNEPLIRINTADQASYFALGVPVEIKPPATAAQADIDAGAESQAAAAGVIRQAALDNGPSHHCYRISAVTMAKPANQVASLERCDLERTPELASTTPGG